jgi:hypothetical protein
MRLMSEHGVVDWPARVFRKKNREKWHCFPWREMQRKMAPFRAACLFAHSWNFFRESFARFGGKKNRSWPPHRPRIEIGALFSNCIALAKFSAAVGLVATPVCKQLTSFCASSAPFPICGGTFTIQKDFTVILSESNAKCNSNIPQNSSRRAGTYD